MHVRCSTSSTRLRPTADSSRSGAGAVTASTHTCSIARRVGVRQARVVAATTASTAPTQAAAVRASTTCGHRREIDHRRRSCETARSGAGRQNERAGHYGERYRRARRVPFAATIDLPPPVVSMLKRRAPITRTALKRPTVEQVWAWRAKPRKPLPKIGRKTRRTQAAWSACRAAVIHRSGGWCETASPACVTSGRHPALDVHHVWPEDRDAGRHDPARCLHLCAAAHRWTHDHPMEAAALGLLRPHDGKVEPCRD